MPQSRPPNALESRNPFLDADIPDTEEIYEPTPFGISALTNVDHLMNDVFQNIEQMLERGAVLPTDLHEEPAPPPAAPLMMPSFILTPPPVEPVATHLGLSDDLMNDPDLEELLSMEQNKPAQKRGGNVLLSALLATVLLTCGLFVGFKYRLWTLIPGLTPTSQVSANPSMAESFPGKTAPVANPDQQFLNYVGRSLDRIDRTTANRTPNAPPSTVPNVPAAPSNSPTVVEHYVPVYQPPLFGAFTNKPTVPNAPIAVAPSPQSTSSPAAPHAAAPRPATRAASAPVPVPAAPAPTMTTAPSPVVAAAPTPNFDPNETHSIIGLLELGDRSAALLTVNGVPQRIEVGGKIGASGWQIVSISNQAAIIQRNGEVRSVYVGQQF
jgi:hypothetical protein